MPSNTGNNDQYQLLSLKPRPAILSEEIPLDTLSPDFKMTDLTASHRSLIGMLSLDMIDEYVPELLHTADFRPIPASIARSEETYRELTNSSKASLNGARSSPDTVVLSAFESTSDCRDQVIATPRPSSPKKRMILSPPALQSLPKKTRRPLKDITLDGNIFPADLFLPNI